MRGRMLDAAAERTGGYDAAIDESGVREGPVIVDGRFRLDAHLGEGGMGVVYRGEDLALGRNVAVKLIGNQRARDPVAIARLRKEARALAQVRHENVVQVYAFGPHAGSFYLAMELVAGSTLQSVVRDHAQRGAYVALERASAIFRGVAKGLAAVHARGLVHRDVKPANVVLEDGTDRPVLIDFGLARKRTALDPRISAAAGTPMYMPPEQANDPDGMAVTMRSDVYALGCLAFELLTGRVAFDAPSTVGLLTAHLSHDRPTLSSLRPELAPLDAVLSRALATKPSARYASASELVAAFDDALAEVAPELPGSQALDACDGRIAGASYRGRSAATRSDDGEPLPGLTIVGSDDATRRIVERAARRLVRSAALLVVDEDGVASVRRHVEQAGRDGYRHIAVVTRRWAAPDARAELAALGVTAIVPKPLHVAVVTSVIERAMAKRSAGGGSR